MRTVGRTGTKARRRGIPVAVRFAMHRSALNRVVYRLRRMGFRDVHSTRIKSDGHLIADGKAIAVRTARIRMVNRHHLQDGKWYHYKYRERHFNIHEHGRHVRHPDFWILIAADDTSHFIMPGRVLSDKRKTVTEFLGRACVRSDRAKPPRRHWYDRYRDNWQVLAQ